MSAGQKETVQCNLCGRKLGGPGQNMTEDFFEAKKEWGYFSGKDMQIHSFCLCEECYDSVIAQFRIPVRKEERREVL